MADLCCKLSEMAKSRIPVRTAVKIQSLNISNGKGSVKNKRCRIRNNNQALVVDSENKMYYRDVEIYRLEEDRVLISGGLLPGEFICTSPIQAVVNGMSVQPVREII